jgi:acetyl-CoA decarbonylase/synthase complex subunit gamma
VSTTLTRRDRLGGLRVRWGIRRFSYTVDPGLYAVGHPDDRSPVLVTANYKLTFDSLRKELAIRDAWVLALDTRGINVWCAAGKGTFGTDEAVRRIEAAQLSQVVSHAVVVLPQLGAPGVSAPNVKRRSGFRVVWGPVRAADLPAFLDAGMRATDEMRRVRFPLRDRLVLAPVEIMGAAKIALAIVAAAAIVGGVGPGIFSLPRAWAAAWPAAAAVAAALLAGAVVTPALLPWVPGRMFALKGAEVGAIAAAVLLVPLASALPALRLAASAIFMVAATSFIAMNYTGTSTFTSLSGVKKEMRAALPWQVGSAALAAALWIAGGFVR